MFDSQGSSKVFDRSLPEGSRHLNCGRSSLRKVIRELEALGEVDEPEEEEEQEEFVTKD